MIVRAFLLWCALLAIASISGIAREAVLIPRIGEMAGRALSTRASIVKRPRVRGMSAPAH